MTDDRSQGAGDDEPALESEDALPAEDDDDRPAVSTAALSEEPIEIVAEARAHNWRLDHYLCRLFPNYSRQLFQKAIGLGAVTVNGLQAKPARRLRVNDVLSIRLPEKPDDTIHPEAIPLSLLHEDDTLVVVDKPAGLIVHPGRGNYGGTLANALQFHFDELSDVAGRHRPGIVHRLDRDTSGVLVVAKDNQVHQKLSSQFEQRTVEKEYVAIVHGEIAFESDWIETHVRVDRRRRERMEVCEPDGHAREAVTFYEVVERFHRFTFVRLRPRTGRTHQLRLHMEHLGHSIVADRPYGGGRRLRPIDLLPANEPRSETDQEPLIARQALHARRLTFDHPATGERLAFESPLPADLVATLDALRRWRAP